MRGAVRTVGSFDVEARLPVRLSLSLGLSHSARNRKDGNHMPELSAGSPLSLGSWWVRAMSRCQPGHDPGLAL